MPTKLRYLITFLFLSSVALVVTASRASTRRVPERSPKSPESRAYSSWVAHFKKSQVSATPGSDSVPIFALFELGTRSDDIFIRVIIPATGEDWQASIPPIHRYPIDGASSTFHVPHEPTRWEIYYVNFETGEEYASSVLVDPTKGKQLMITGTIEYGTTSFLQNDEGWIRD